MTGSVRTTKVRWQIIYSFNSDPTIQQPGFNFPRQQWFLLNRFCTEQTLRCLQKEMATYRHWSVSLWQDPDDVPHCWILSPTKLNGSLFRLHSADEDAVSWLTSYGSWHACEKKIAKGIRISCAKFHCNRLTTVRDIQHYASLMFLAHSVLLLLLLLLLVQLSVVVVVIAIIVIEDCRRRLPEILQFVTNATAVRIWVERCFQGKVNTSS